jgi:hypothetical protein
MVKLLEDQLEAKRQDVDRQKSVKADADAAVAARLKEQKKMMRELHKLEQNAQEKV